MGKDGETAKLSVVSWEISSLSSLAGFTFVLMLLAAVSAALFVWSLARMRRDYRLAEAAERLEAVSLKPIVRRYVPRRLRSNRRAEEVLLVKQIIDRRRPGHRRLAIASIAVLLCSTGTSAYFLQRNLRTAARLATKAPPGIDALAAIQGIWGWRADFARSCSENPQSISVSTDHKTLSIHYARSSGKADFDIVSVQPDTIVLSAPGPGGNPISVFIKFLTVDTYIANNNYRPVWTTGVIERCR